jgi:hypothetical protein
MNRPDATHTHRLIQVAICGISNAELLRSADLVYLIVKKKKN